MHRTAPLLVVLAAFAIAASPAAAQPPEPCAPDNPVDECFDQDTTGVDSLAEDDELFGAALAFGDFDNDGFDDLAVGAPGDRGTANGGGMVHVFYGGEDGLVLTSGTDEFDQAAIPGEDVEANDGFGFALAAGDFDDDGFDDLAIGAPFENHPGCPFGCVDSGVFHVVYGGSGGLDLAGAETLTMDDLGINQHGAGDGHEFGSVLAAGNVGFSGGEDLLVCAPGFLQESGSCYLVFGSPDGLNHGTPASFGAGGSEADERMGADATTFQGIAFFGSPLADSPGLPDAGRVYVDPPVGLNTAIEEQHVASDQANHQFTEFGRALAAGDFDDDGFGDLVIGAPELNLGNADSGAAYVAFGEPGGFDPEDLEAQILTQDLLLFPGEIEAGDVTGSELAVGDFDGDGFDDLAIGAPGEDPVNVGQTIVVFGGAGGIDLDRVEGFFESGLGGTNLADDNLGQVLATGDVDGDGRDELAFGVPRKDVGAATDAGMVYVHYFPAPPPGPGVVFADGFESGDTSAWSDVVP